MFRDIKRPLRSGRTKRVQTYTVPFLSLSKEKFKYKSFEMPKRKPYGKGTRFKSTGVVFAEQHFRVITEAVIIRLWSKIEAFQICSYLFRLPCAISNNHFSFRLRRGILRGKEQMNIYDSLLNRTHGSMLYTRNVLTSGWKESECLRNSK